MALDTSMTPSVDEEDAPVAELVFSCCICQATVTDVYATVESDQGFHSGSSGEDGIVTKMYIGSCSHVVCSKHLENGAVPFHPEDQHPSAACPRCRLERSDNSPKDLFAIQGLSPGKYDPTIPEMWMRCPAIKLDDSIAGMDAIRFQYMALCHHGRQVRKHWKAALQKETIADAALLKERKIRKKLQTEQVELQKKIEDLQKAEAQLKKWEDRKPVINHYMDAFCEMSKDHERMRGQLIELGVDVPMRSYLFDAGESSKLHQKQSDFDLIETHLDSGEPIRVTNRQASEDEHLSSARKRKHHELVNNASAQNSRQASRDLMPPPHPRPVQRDVHHPSPGLPPTMSQVRSTPRPRVFGDDKQQQPSRIESRKRRYRNPATHFEHVPSKPEQTMRRISPASSHDIRAALHQHSLPQSDTISLGYDPRPRQDRDIHDPVPLAQLSLQSEGLGDQGMNYSIEDQRSIEHNYNVTPVAITIHPQYHRRQNITSRYNYEYPGNLPIRLSPSVYESPPGMNPFQQSELLGTRAPYDLVQNQSTYADSPFFKHNGSISRQDTMQRPPTRGNRSQQQFSMLGDKQHMPTARIYEPRIFDEIPDSARGSSSQFYASKYVSPQNNQRPSIHRQQHTAVPSTPRNSQGFFQRPDRPLPPPVFRPPPKPQPQNRGGRITLPPSSAGTIPLKVDQDSAVSQIRGVRGTTSYHNSPIYRSSNLDYSSTMPLFSGSGRQGIRR